jgi:hypothetical protein
MVSSGCKIVPVTDDDGLVWFTVIAINKKEKSLSAVDTSGHRLNLCVRERKKCFPSAPSNQKVVS